MSNRKVLERYVKRPEINKAGLAREIGVARQLLYAYLWPARHPTIRVSARCRALIEGYVHTKLRRAMAA